VSAEAPVIRLVDAGKRYVKYEDHPTLLNSVLHFGARRSRPRLWALRHCDLEIGHGECVGVMGPNGSGKSTLLQMMAGVTAPTEGSVHVGGHVAPLVQVGVGFHPELTGRENIYVNGTILGLSRPRIDALFDSIVDFSELADFIDTPVKFYSSGMYVRLGFSIAVASSPDVLLVDEVLAVGDIAFQAKCFERMEEIREQGKTMVFVSHSVHLIRQLCARSIIVHSGRVFFDGKTDDAISMYYEWVGKRFVVEDGSAEVVTDDAPVTVEIDMLDTSGRPTRHITSGETAVVRMEARMRRPVDAPSLAIQVSSASGVKIYQELFTDRVGPRHEEERLSCEFRVALPLTTGSYSVDACILEGGIGQVVAWSRPLSFHVSGRDHVTGAADLSASVDVVSPPESDGYRSR
jgi:ABC-2 type transport system ATP-binding protein